MAELADTVTIPAPLAYASNDVYFANGGATQYIHGIRIVPPETRVWDVIGIAWNYLGTNWNTPAAGTALGSGGLLWFTVHNQVVDGTPDLSSALASEQLAADTSGPGAGGNVYRHDQRTRALIGATTTSFLIHMSIPGGLSVVAGLPIWLLIRNMHADPVLNASGPNWVTTRNTILLPDGTVKTPPNHANTTTAASYSTHGLDPREVVASRALATDAWQFSTTVGRYPGASSGVDNGNDHARVPVYFWRELGSTRLRSKMPFTGQRIASGATPTVTRVNAPSAGTLKYAVAYPTTSGTCTVTAQVLNADGTNKGSAVTSPASAAAPTGGGPVVVQFGTPVAVLAGEGIQLSCSKAVWVSVADTYLRRMFDESDDWQYSAASAANYPGLAAFGARGVADWPWSHSNRQAAATGQAGATAVATNLVASDAEVSFSAARGAANPDPKRVRIVDVHVGANRAFTAAVTNDTAGWLRLRVGLTGSIAVSVTGTADTDLYLVPTNQATNGSYTATVTITPAQGGDTVPAISASMSVTDAQPVGSYDAEVAAVATRFWKLEETTGDFADSKGGASLAVTGSGIVRGIDINAPITTGGAAFRASVDALGSSVIAHWPLGELPGGGASGTVTYGALGNTNSAAGKTSDTVPWPAGAAVGDVAVLGVHIESATAVTTAVSSGGPTAWTQRAGTQITGAGDRNSLWTKRVETGDLANPVSVTWGGTAVRCTSAIVIADGAKATGEFVNQVTGTTGSSATFTATGFTTTAKSLVLYFEMSRWDLNEAPPAGFTERLDVNSSEIYVASLSQGAAGAVASTGATTPGGESTAYAAFLIAIEPEGAATVNAIDRKNNRNGVPNGTITRNVTTLLTDGSLDGAVDVGGTDAVPATGHFEVPATTAFQTAAFTVLAWAKVTGGQGSTRTVIAHRDSGSGIARGWYLVASSTNKWRFLSGLSDNTFVTVESIENVQVGETVFLAGTWEGGVPKLYVNAGAANTAAPSGTYNPTHAVDRPLRIAAGTNETTASGFFRGVIDECVLLDQALSANQIQSLYLAGRTGASPGSGSPPPPPPSGITVTTMTPSASSATTLQMLGRLTNLGGVTGTAFFQYGTSAGSLTSQTPGESINGTDQFVSHLVTGLTAATTYFFRLVYNPSTGGQLVGSTLSAVTP